MNTDMVVEDYVTIFRKTRESTPSAPSSINYDYYIATFESETLTRVNLLFMVTPLHVGM